MTIGEVVALRIGDIVFAIDLHLDHHALIFLRDEYWVYKIDNQIHVLQTEARL